MKAKNETPKVENPKGSPAELKKKRKINKSRIKLKNIIEKNQNVKISYK